jgi:predicted metal-dependent hydrolase
MAFTPPTDLAHIPWQLKASSKRRSLGLSVSPAGISLYFPLGTSLNTLESFVRDKHHWLLEKTAKWYRASSNSPTSEARDSAACWTPDTPVWWQGNLCPLGTLLSDLKPPASIWSADDWAQPLHHQQAQWRRLLQRESRKLLDTQWPQALKLTGLCPQQVSCKLYKSAWGRCSSRGDIILNSLLLMAPPQVQHYVMIHELCHLKVPNHSAAFWQWVHRFLPAAEVVNAKSWLRTHGSTVMMWSGLLPGRVAPLQ